MEIALALRISTSLQSAFKSVKFNGKYYVGGGVFENFPIKFWDINNIINKDTLGFRLSNESQISNNYDVKIKSFFEYTYNMYDSSLEKLERCYISDETGKDYSRVIDINTFDISSGDFNISFENKLRLIDSGYYVARKYILKYHPDKIGDIEINDDCMNQIYDSIADQPQNGVKWCC